MEDRKNELRRALRAAILEIPRAEVEAIVADELSSEPLWRWELRPPRNNYESNLLVLIDADGCDAAFIYETGATARWEIGPLYAGRFEYKLLPVKGYANSFRNAYYQVVGDLKQIVPDAMITVPFGDSSEICFDH